MLRKRQEFEAREAANEMRRKELEEIRKRDEERKRMEDLRKERERQDKYQAAVESEEMRKMTIKQRAEEKERLLAELYARRKKENDIRKVEQEFEMKLRLDKVGNDVCDWLCENWVMMSADTRCNQLVDVLTG
jgi:signal recognition particle GTPase